jgi:hypothetical protein
VSAAVASGGASAITQGNTKAEVVDTGVDGNFSVVTEGVERIHVDPFGNIGLGDATPQANLVVGVDTTMGIALGAGNAYIQKHLEVDGSVYVGTGVFTHATGVQDVYVGHVLQVDGGLYAGDFTLPSGPTVNAISTNTALGASNLILPTQGAVKGYVDTAIGGISLNSIFQLNSNVTVTDVGVGQVAVTTDDIEVARFTGGRVGIGVVSPSSSLDVGGGTPTYIDGVNDILVKGDIESDGTIYGNIGVSGTMVLMPPASTLSVVAGTGVAPLTNSMLRVVGSGGAVDVSANPQIAVGHDGQELVIIGTSNTNTVKFNSNNGLSLAGGVPFTLGQGAVLRLIYDGSVGLWREISRSDF